MNLVNLRRKADYYHSDAPDWVRSIWPRQESFGWFIKNNRQALVDQDAVVRLGRDYFVDKEKFPVVAGSLLGVKSEEVTT